MSLIVNDRVQEVSTSTGSGPFVLGGVVTGYQTFSTGIGNKNSTYYTITDGTNWMDILGTYTSAANSITVDKILTSSAGGTTAVSFAAGTKNVFCTYPASTAVLSAPASYPTIQPSLNLDFANSKQLDPRITFVRNSTATYYDGQTSALAEQNLLLQSQFASGWSVLGSSIATPSIAPDGTTTALILSEDTSTGQHRTNQQLLSTPIASIVFSVYVKWNVGTRNIVLIPQGTSAHTVGIIFNSSGAYVSTTTGNGTITNYGSSTLSNGWFRFWVNYTPTQASTLNIIALYDGTTNSYVGDGTSSIYVWGAQLEQRSSVTAYTPTTTTAITNYIPVLMTAPANVARFNCDPITRNSLGLLIEESRTNLLTYSSDFSNAVWTKIATTITTAVSVAPDGTLTASKMISNPSNAYHYGSRTIAVSASTTYTYSIYAKAGEYNTGFINFPNDTKLSIFNLATGTVISSASGVSTSIQSVGNGWYRLICTYTTGIAETTTAAWFGLSPSPFLGNGYSGIYIWGAQLEAGSFATSYIPTVASTVTRAADQASMTGTNFSSWWNQSQGSMYAETTNASNGIIYGRIASINGANSSIELLTYPNSNLGGAVSLNNSFIFNSFVTASVLTVLTKSLISYSATSVSLIANGNTVLSAALTALPTNLNKLNIGSNFSNQYVLCGHIRKLSYYPVALSSANLVALTS